MYTSFKELLETSAGRFTQISLDPFWWDTYRVIGEKGLLKSVKKKDWDEGKLTSTTWA